MTGPALPACTHRPPCPGCPRYGEAGVAPAALTALRRLAEETGAELEAVGEGEPLGHRHRARLMVRGRAASPKVGLFQAGSHRIVDTPRCRVHHPLVNRAAAALKEAIRATGTPPYAEAPHRGLVRAMQLVVERASQTVQVVVVTRSESPEEAAPLLGALSERLGEALHSLWWNGQPGRTNVILGERWQKQCGADAVRERIGGADVFFPPDAFGQSHLALADAIVLAVHAAVPPKARVLELHAGCGAIGLGLAARAHEVAFNERDGGSLRGLAMGLAALPDAARTRTLPGPAAGHLEALDACDVTIVDPPRKGLEPALTARLAERPPARVVYVSCGLESFLADAATLLAGGRLALRRLAPYALFPFTEHVETLAVFERR